MSRFFSDTYKWSLYEKYRNGFTLTELCEISGITDKPLRNWFRYIDSQYAQSAQLSVKSAQQKNTHLRQTVTLRQTELNLLSKIIAEIPESQRVSSAHLLLSTYGPNQVCCSLGIRKSNLYYRIFHRPETTVYEKHDQELRPAIREICDRNIKRLSSENIRQQLLTWQLNNRESACQRREKVVK